MTSSGGPTWCSTWPLPWVFSGQILGPHFEHLAREFIRRHASAAMLGGAVATVGPAVISDARARRTHELDVVVHGRAEDGGAPLLAIGEANHTSRQRGLADLRRLEHIRGLLESAGHRGASDARLLLFSTAGFDADLTASALIPPACATLLNGRNPLPQPTSPRLPLSTSTKPSTAKVLT